MFEKVNCFNSLWYKVLMFEKDILHQISLVLVNNIINILILLCKNAKQKEKKLSNKFKLAVTVQIGPLNWILFNTSHLQRPQFINLWILFVLLQLIIYFFLIIQHLCLTIFSLYAFRYLLYVKTV